MSASAEPFLPELSWSLVSDMSEIRIQCATVVSLRSFPLSSCDIFLLFWFVVSLYIPVIVVVSFCYRYCTFGICGLSHSAFDGLVWLEI